MRSTQALPQAVNVGPEPKLQCEQSIPPSADIGPPHPADPIGPHVCAHDPLTHTCPSAHEWPQLPQLDESVDVSVQNAVAFRPPPLHDDCPEGQLAPQKPFAQNPPPGQRGVQTPLWQDWPTSHTVPHDPQLLGSDCRSTHWVPHAENVCPPKPQCEQSIPPSADIGPPQPIAVFAPPQRTAHCPARQPWPDGHAFPHAPQLLGSVCVSTHWDGELLPQTVVPRGHDEPQ